MTKTTKVYLETRTVGDHFATVGVVRSVATRRRMAETIEVPYDFIDAAVEKAKTLALRRGWTVVEDR